MIGFHDHGLVISLHALTDNEFATEADEDVILGFIFCSLIPFL